MCRKVRFTLDDLSGESSPSGLWSYRARIGSDVDKEGMDVVVDVEAWPDADNRCEFAAR